MKKYWLAALVFLIVPLSGVSIDIYAPSLPAVSDYFHVAKNLSQLTITAYLVGLGFMQLFAGSISDSFGRKKPFMVALIVFMMTTFLIPCSQTIYHLIFLRFMQGASLAVTVVPMRSVMTDLFEGEELQKMMTYMTMSWSLGPIVAPAIGGYLQYYAGWKANFYFLGIYSVIVFVLALLFLFETSKQRHPFYLSSMLKRYRNMLVHREYVNYVMTGSLLFSLITLFGIAGPFFIQTVLHYSAAAFGQFTLVMGVAWFLGVMSNRFMLGVPLAVKANVCFYLMACTVALMFVVSLFYSVLIYNLVIPMGFLFFFSGILYPSYFIQSVMLFREYSASANALYNAGAFFVAGVVSGLGSLVRVDTEVPFVLVVGGLVGVCIAIRALPSPRLAFSC
jgi:DHA1 family bicyclomycin/chloramphenicol resistance-like MFS transporter